MTFNIEALGSKIFKALESAEFKENATVITTTPSSVSQENPHRFVLDQIRMALLHYDGEKKARVIFMVKQHLATQEPSKELKLLLERVLEVVEGYNLTGKVLTSPQKESPPPPERTPAGALVPRALFEDTISDIEKFNPQ